MFYLITLSFIGGIALYSFVRVPVFYLYVLFLLCGSGYLLTKNRRIGVITIVVIFLLLGYLRFAVAGRGVAIAGRGNIALYEGRTFTAHGIVVDEPLIEEHTARYTIGELELADDGRAVAGRLMLTMRQYPRLVMGNSVTFSCSLQKDETVPYFYRARLAGQGIYAYCRYPDRIEIRERKTRSAWIGIRSSLSMFRRGLVSRIEEIIPAPHSSLLSGLLLGDISSMPRYIKEAFIDTGTIHIVAISGYNITIIISFLFLIAPYLGLSRRITWVFVVPMVISFVVSTGIESSAVRASVMGLVAAVAGEAGRLSDVRRVLVIAALVMLLINPYLLVFDVGFQLSFLATVGLVYITPAVDAVLRVLSSRLRDMIPVLAKTPPPAIGAALATIKQSATTTIGATLAVSPIILITFGTVSFIAPLVNIAVLWAVPFTMALGFASILFSFAWYPMGEVFGWSAWVFLEYIIRVVNLFA